MDNQLVCQLTLMGSSIKEHFYYIVYKKKNPPTQKRGDAISRFDVKDSQISLLLACMATSAPDILPICQPAHKI